MPEKLLTIEEASAALGLSLAEVKALVEKGTLPAYKIDGKYLRFRREQIDAIRNEISQTKIVKSEGWSQEPTAKSQQPLSYHRSFTEGLVDFFYFNDFYIITAGIACILLWIIFR